MNQTNNMKGKTFKYGVNEFIKATNGLFETPKYALFFSRSDWAISFKYRLKSDLSTKCDLFLSNINGTTAPVKQVYVFIMVTSYECCCDHNMQPKKAKTHSEHITPENIPNIKYNVPISL